MRQRLVAAAIAVPLLLIRDVVLLARALNNKPWHRAVFWLPHATLAIEFITVLLFLGYLLKHPLSDDPPPYQKEAPQTQMVKRPNAIAIDGAKSLNPPDMMAHGALAQARRLSSMQPSVRTQTNSEVAADAAWDDATLENGVVGNDAPSLTSAQATRGSAEADRHISAPTPSRANHAVPVTQLEQAIPKAGGHIDWDTPTPVNGSSDGPKKGA